jgi:hypothetical protein
MLSVEKIFSMFCRSGIYFAEVRKGGKANENSGFGYR